MKSKILIVEDDDMWIDYFKKTISTHNQYFDFLYTKTIKETLEVLENNEIRLIFLDLLLPDSFSAVDTLRTITKKAEYIPIIVISFVEDKKIRKEAKNLGIDHYLLKGEYSKEEFFNVVQKTIKDTTNKLQPIYKERVHNIILSLKEMEKKLEFLYNDEINGGNNA